MKRRPTYVLEKAVKGMLPKNRLGREMFRHLHVYAGAEHPHVAQNPENLTF
jgi:large subunit ribosomal protein L13